MSEPEEDVRVVDDVSSLTDAKCCQCESFATLQTRSLVWIHLEAFSPCFRCSPAKFTGSAATELYWPFCKTCAGQKLQSAPLRKIVLPREAWDEPPEAVQHHQDYYARKVREFYEILLPHKDVDQLLHKYRGSADLLYSSVCMKYKPKQVTKPVHQGIPTNHQRIPGSVSCSRGR